MKLGTLILFIAGLFLASGCGDSHCIDGNHDVRTEYRSPGSFSEVVSTGSFDVRILQDSVNEVIIQAESNIIPYIRTSIKGNTLELGVVDSKCLRNNEEIVVTVRAININTVGLEGSGNVFAENVTGDFTNIFISGSGELNAGVQADELYAVISGSGNIETWGAVNEGELLISGSGNIYAYDLYQNRCNAGISGSGSMFVTVKDYLDVNISGSGNVYYKGNPVVHTVITGSGMVVHKF